MDNIKILSHNMWCLPLYNRKPLLIEIYREEMPDIICLQEVTYVIQNQGFLTDIGEEYETVLPKVDEYFNNTPILYRKDLFTLIESGWHLFDGKNNADTKSITWAVFERKSDCKRIGVCSTHFWWEAKSAEDDLDRRYHAEQSLAYINYIVCKYKVPVILGGDLNCKIGSLAYNHLIASGGTDCRIAAKVYDKRINTLHELPLFDEKSCKYSKAEYVPGTHLDAIDHMIVFNNYNIVIDELKVINTDSALIASDHCPMYINFKFN